MLALEIKIQTLGSLIAAGSMFPGLSVAEVGKYKMSSQYYPFRLNIQGAFS